MSTLPGSAKNIREAAERIKAFIQSMEFEELVAKDYIVIVGRIEPNIEPRHKTAIENMLKSRDNTIVRARIRCTDTPERYPKVQFLDISHDVVDSETLY